MTTHFDAVDFFTDEATAQDPYPYLDALVAAHPVWREPHHGVVMVTGYEEALAVLRDATTFSSCNVTSGPEPKFPVELEGDDITALVEEHRDSLMNADQIVAFDPPKHSAHRALIMGLITPKRLKENEEFMWRLVDRALDAILPAGQCEFINDFAQRYTLLVIADLLGVPESDHRMLLERMGLGERLSGMMNQSSDFHDVDNIYDYFIEAIEDRRRNPREDVLTGMALAKFPDGSLPELVDVARIASNVFAAGQETTVRLLGATLVRIADDAELQQRLRRDTELIPNFVEETLRVDGPIRGDFRLALKSTTLGGVDIPAGTTVMVLNGAANRDPRRYERPGELLLDRSNSRQHVGFGHGVHTCPGSPLARSEVRITIERIFARTSDIRISEAAHGPAGARRYSYLPTFMFRGLAALHLEYTPIQ